MLDAQRHLTLPRNFLSRCRNPLLLILRVTTVIAALTGDLAGFAQPPASPTCHHLRCGRCRCASAAVYATGGLVRLRPTVCRLPVCDCRTDRELPAARPGREMVVLSPVAAVRWRAGAIVVRAQLPLIARPYFAGPPVNCASLQPRFRVGTAQENIADTVQRAAVIAMRRRGRINVPSAPAVPRATTRAG